MSSLPTNMKPVVIEVNNKCNCTWLAGNTVVLSNQHPTGNTPVASYSFTCKILDDRGLYLYVDTRPSGYRFWCTQCKNNDPMSFTYFTEQQTEFVASMMRRFSLIEDTKKKLDKKISDLTETLAEERERFDREMTQEKEEADTRLGSALEEAKSRAIYFAAKEEQWEKEDTERREYERKKRTGLALIRAVGKFDLDSCARDWIGEVARDFLRACEDMQKLVRALLFVQGVISNCKEQENRLLGNPVPTFDKKNDLFLEMMITVLGSEPNQNTVPLLGTPGVVYSNTKALEEAAAEAEDENNENNNNNNNEKTKKSEQQQQKEANNRPVLHIPFEFLASNAATQNIRRLPKTNYRLCPNHDVCSNEPTCTFFHLKTMKLRFARSGEVTFPTVFIRDKGDLQQQKSLLAAASEGCIDPNCHCRTRIHLHPCVKPLLHITWYERDQIWKHIVAVTESDDMTLNLESLKKEKMRFERFLGRHPNVLSAPSAGDLKGFVAANCPPEARSPTSSSSQPRGDEDDDNENNEGAGEIINATAAATAAAGGGGNFGSEGGEHEAERRRLEGDYKRPTSASTRKNSSSSGENNNNSSSNEDLEGKEQLEREQLQQEDDDDDDDFDESQFPDGTIEGLEQAVFNCFAKCRQNIMLEYNRIREIQQLYTTFDFYFMQLREYGDSLNFFYKIPRDLDKLIEDITDTSLRCGELVRMPKPALSSEGRAFAVGVALVIRETEQTFEDLAQLRDRVDEYKVHIEKSKKAHQSEMEIETIERQIDHKSKELQRSRKRIELLEAEIEVLADAEDEFEATEKKTERNKANNEAQNKHKELLALQEQHHERFLVLVEARDSIVRDLELKDSEATRWSDLLGAGNEGLASSRNLIDFVKTKRANAANASSPVSGTATAAASLTPSPASRK